jgi:hypothetical protein
MSHAHAPHSAGTGFSLYIKSIGQGRLCPAELRCPKALDIPFGATYYDLEDGVGGPSQTPWVGGVDLEEYFFEQYTSTPTSKSQINGTLAPQPKPTTGEREPPAHPGYQIAPVGQLQIIVKSPMNAIKAFLVPYDLRSLPFGGRLLARERTYVYTPCLQARIGEGEGGSPDVRGKQKESLRYAYQLQFTCLSSTTGNGFSDSIRQTKDRARRESSTTRRTSLPATRNDHNDINENEIGNGNGKNQGEAVYYLSRAIRVVFTSTPPEPDQQLRTERTNEIVPCTHTSPVSGTGTGLGAGTSGPKTQARRRSSTGFQISPSRTHEDWEIVRRKWIARRDRDISESAIEDDEEGSQSSRSSSPSKSTYRPSAPGDIKEVPLILIPVSRPDIPPFNAPTRTLTPVPQPFNIPDDTPKARAKPPQSPRSRFRTRQFRRTSTEERELSEKLRTMGLE